MLHVHSVDLRLEKGGVVDSEAPHHSAFAMHSLKHYTSICGLNLKEHAIEFLIPVISTEAP